MVLVYSDDYKLMLELLNKGSEFAKETKKSLTAVVIGKDDYSSDYIGIYELRYCEAVNKD